MGLALAGAAVPGTARENTDSKTSPVVKIMAASGEAAGSCVYPI